jgi:hypothetical protein
MNNHKNTSTYDDQNSSHQMPVPKNELDIALSCIRKTISNSIHNGEEEEAAAAAAELPQQNHSDSRKLLQREMIASLTSAITNCVVAIDDQDYIQQYVKYDTPMKRDIQKAFEIDNSNDDDISLDDDCYDSGSSCSEDSEDSDSDDDEYLDTAALQRAKELRELVRKKAAEIRAIKETKLTVLMEEVKKEIDEWKKMHDVRQLRGKGEKENGDCSGGGDDDDDHDNVEMLDENGFIYQRLQSMNISLSNLKSTLQTIDVELPDKLESLQNTTETVCNYIKKIEHDHQAKLSNNNDDGGEEANNNGLSRVERAILSRVDTNKLSSFPNESRGNENDTTKYNNKKSKLREMDAEQRFALFVSQTDSHWNM